MANIAKALKEDFSKLVGKDNAGFLVEEYPQYGNGTITDQFVSRNPSISPLASESLFLCSGTRYFEGIDTYIQTGKSGDAFLVCKHCGKKFLFVRENITTVTFDLSCVCGATLEIEEE